MSRTGRRAILVTTIIVATLAAFSVVWTLMTPHHTPSIARNTAPASETVEEKPISTDNAIENPSGAFLICNDEIAVTVVDDARHDEMVEFMEKTYGVTACEPIENNNSTRHFRLSEPMEFEELQQLVSDIREHSELISDAYFVEHPVSIQQSIEQARATREKAAIENANLNYNAIGDSPQETETPAS